MRTEATSPSVGKTTPRISTTFDPSFRRSARWSSERGPLDQQAVSVALYASPIRRPDGTRAMTISSTVEASIVT